MQRLDNTAVQLTDDEQIMGDFLTFLEEERGMSEKEAIVYLANISSKIDDVFVPSFLSYLRGES